jgi:Methyltransferase domain
MTSVKDLTTEPIFSLHWQMTNCERFAMQDLLRRLQPDLSLEIGTYRGGSLQVISHFSRNVISIDIDPEVEKHLSNKFSNVNYRCGNSYELLPGLLKESENSSRDIEFILIDGDHSTQGVQRDINALLQYKPRKKCVILMHDSFNPDCREGIKTASWSTSPHVQWVELDFIPGIYHYEAYDTAAAKTMWGGFACAVLDSTPRQEKLMIQESQRGLFEAVFANSSHALSPRQPPLAKRVLNRLRRFLQ